MPDIAASLHKTTDLLDRKGFPDTSFSEQLVLGMVLGGQASFDDISLINRRSFETEKHAAIYDAIADLAGRGNPTDIAAVAQYLNYKGTIGAAGGVTYLADLTDVPSAANIDHHVELIAQRAQAREFVGLVLRESEQIICGADFEECRERIVRAAEQRVSIAKEKQEMFSPVEIVGDINRFFGKQEPGVFTGIHGIDRITYGLQPRELIIVGASPSMGKTALATQIATNAALTGYNTEIISLEMGKEELLMRIVCQMAGASYLDVRRGEIRAEERAALMIAFHQISEAPLYIDDRVHWTTIHVKNHLKARKAANMPVQLLIIDYLQLMPISHGSRRENRNLDISEITRGLKLIAKEFDVPIVVLSQLTRNSARENRPPILADLRDSGDIEAGGDKVFLLWHDKQRELEDKRWSEIIVAKQRNGETGGVPTFFVKRCAKFVDRTE